MAGKSRRRDKRALDNLTKYAGQYQYWTPKPGMPENTWTVTRSTGEDVLKHAQKEIPSLVKKTNEKLQGNDK